MLARVGRLFFWSFHSFSLFHRPVCLIVVLFAITNIDLLVKGLCFGHMTVTVQCENWNHIESNWIEWNCLHTNRPYNVICHGSVILYSLQCLWWRAALNPASFSISPSLPLSLFLVSISCFCVSASMCVVCHFYANASDGKTAQRKLLVCHLVVMLRFFFLLACLDKTFLHGTNLTGFELYFDCLLRSHEDCRALIRSKCFGTTEQ